MHSHHATLSVTAHDAVEMSMFVVLFCPVSKSKKLGGPLEHPFQKPIGEHQRDGCSIPPHHEQSWTPMQYLTQQAALLATQLVVQPRQCTDMSTLRAGMHFSFCKQNMSMCARAACTACVPSD
eukprot:4855721-Amphidinium_carterae.1